VSASARVESQGRANPARGSADPVFNVVDAGKRGASGARAVRLAGARASRRPPSELAFTQLPKALGVGHGSRINRNFRFRSAAAAVAASEPACP
jgi:hypothetical protein